MRSQYCGQITEEHLDQEVELCGWVHRRRDHGGVIFIDLRDREGIVQVVFDPDRAEPFAIADSVRNEYVLKARGRVRRRPEGTENPKMITGQVEVLGYDLEILNAAKTPPFQLDEDDVGEDVRLRYRYIDLRRPEMQHRLKSRARVTSVLRRYLDGHGFLDIETPMLTRATPEGARDYLVPSRVHQGSFYALPQSPQLFKQLLMMSGMDRYYQIVRCFRDEDLRADRQPEFTQLDVETSFMNEDEIMHLMEGMIRELFAEVLQVDLPDPFPRMTYAEAVERFGIDRPDLRIPLELITVSDLMAGVDFKVFAGPATDPRGRVAALKVPGGNRLTRKEIDGYTDFVGRYGAKGLAYIKVNDRAQGRDGLQSPIIKFLPDETLNGILDRTGAADGDLIFFGADKAKVVNESLAALRVKLGHDLDLSRATGSRCGWSISPCSNTTKRTAVSTPCIIPLPRLRWGRSTSWKPMPSWPCLAPTTSCSTARRSAGAPSASTGPTCSARCSSCWVSARKKPARSSASCWMRWSTARRPMAGSPSGWTGWSCS